MEELLLQKLQPFFYVMGMIIVSQLGLIINVWLKRSEKKEDKLEARLKAIEDGVHEIDESIIRLETKLEVTAGKHERDINNLGAKVRTINA